MGQEFVHETSPALKRRVISWWASGVEMEGRGSSQEAGVATDANEGGGVDDEAGLRDRGASLSHSRRYVDWEIKTSLRRGSYTPNGLLGIILPSQGLRTHFRLTLDEDEESAD